MSKDKTAIVTEEKPLANPQGKTVEELKEVARTLQTQVNHHREKRLHHQMMETKAQGALEVMLQMIPKEEVEEMITEEAKNLHQNGQKTS